MSNQKIPIAIVGLRFGRQIVEQVVNGPANPFFELKAVCDLDEEKTQEMATKYQVEGFTDLDQLLARDDIPTIGLFTGPVGRAALIRKIINAGKDVMTTKPFEHDPEAAEAILKEVKEKRRILHLNSPAPELPPDLQVIKQWEKTYELGRPVACTANVWVRYHEQSDGSWYDDPDLCPIPPIYRLGIYIINDLIRVLGSVDAVQAFSSRIFTGRPTADNGLLSICFQNGALATIYASFCVEDGAIYRNGLILNYEKGTIYRNIGATPRTEDMHLQLMQGTSESGAKLVAETRVSEGSGIYQWKNFYRAVNGETIDNEVSDLEIVEPLRIIAAMREAEKTGKTIKIKH